MAEKKDAAKKSTAKKASAKKQTKKEFEFFKARVVGGNLNIRKEAKMAEDNIAGVLSDGTVVEITGEKGDWYRIEQGWIMKKYIEVVKE